MGKVLIGKEELEAYDKIKKVPHGACADMAG